MASRISVVQDRLRDEDADAVLLSFLPDIRWACGFTGSNALLIVRHAEAHFLTDGRYDDQAREEVQGATVHVARGGLRPYAAENGLLNDATDVLFQSDHVTVDTREQLEETFETVSWRPCPQFLTAQVAVKQEHEVQRMREAQRITEAVFEAILDTMRPGVSERDIAAEVVYQHLRRGAEGMAFDPIVASGPNAARPHARPTNRTLQRGDMIVLDMGCFANGYASDMTRTVALGTPSKAAENGYAVVREAQQRAVEAARAGLQTNELDAVARDCIEDHGFEDAFAHSLGHGIGLQVHEWPRVASTTEDELPEGACITIEPGVYVPEEGYGVRIEDIVQLHPGGCDILTRTSKELIIL